MKKFLKKFIALILLIIILFNLTGCYDATGIEELAYVVAIGLDVTDDNALELTLQFATSGDSSSSSSSSSSSNGSSNSSSQSSGNSLTTVKCSTINSGLSIINGHISKKVDLSHCQELIFSEKLAYMGLSEYLDTFVNNMELRTDCSIVITKCTAKDFLSNVNPSLETLTARYYEASLNSSEYTGYTIDVSLSEFYSQMKDTYSQAYAILGGLSSKSSNNSLKVNANYLAGEDPIEDSDITDSLGIAVFKDDKLVGELTGLDSICHVIVNNNLKQCTLSVPSPFESGKYLDLLLTSEKNTKSSVNMINSSALINVEVYLTGYGLSLNENISYNSEESIDLLETYAKKYITDQIENYLYKTAKEYNSDICGFGKYTVKNYLTLDEWYNANWLENYKDSFFNVTVNLTIKSGNIFTKS